MRLIDADALSQKWQDVLNEKADEKGTVAYRTFELFIERLAEEPTIDAVPVIRCQNCKHCEDGLCYHPRSNGLADVLMVLDDDFCSYGEPKKGDADGQI